jgi:hypothetical protein
VGDAAAKSQGRPSGAAARAQARVLPRIGYAALLVEAAALTGYYATHEVPPGDGVGYAIGWTGTASMLLMHVYSLRKRLPALASWGRLSAWLHLHIFLGLQGALLVSFHSLHLTRLGNISGATIALVAIVVASGSFGRYVYSWLPRNLTGDRLSAKEAQDELMRLGPAVTALAGRHPALAEFVGDPQNLPALTGRLSLAQLIAEDRRTRRTLARIDAALAGAAQQAAAEPEFAEWAAALRRRAQLARRLTVLTASERLFRNWHLFHKPLTFILLGAVVLHVVAHYVYASRFAG